MKTKNLLLSAILGIALSGVVLTGCKKDNSPTSYTDITAGEDQSTATNAMNDSKNVSDDAMQGNSSQYAPRQAGLAGLTPHCFPHWSKDTSTGGKMDSLYIIFGNDTNPVFCNDNVYRQGEIIVYWRNNGGLSHAYFTQGDTIYMTFRNYARGNSLSNMIGISGIRTLTNNGNGGWTVSTYPNITLTYSTGQTATWNALYTYAVSSSNPSYYEITGHASGASRNGVAYTVSITSALYVTVARPWNEGCAYIEAGSISINVPSYSIVVSFGSALGTCNSDAVATINGVNFSFNQ